MIWEYLQCQQFFGEKVVIRILYGNDFNYAIENLNFTKEQIKKNKLHHES